jgi:hypothetical protein
LRTMNGQLRSWLKPVANKQHYLDALQRVIEHLHKCAAYWIRSEHVHETFQGKTVWDGDVEVYGLAGHQKATRAYGWAHLDGDKDQETRYVAVIEVPPVQDAKTAVQASIMADLKKGQS